MHVGKAQSRWVFLGRRGTGDEPFSHRGRAATVKERDVVREFERQAEVVKDVSEESESVRPSLVSFK